MLPLMAALSWLRSRPRYGRCGTASPTPHQALRTRPRRRRRRRPRIWADRTVLVRSLANPNRNPRKSCNPNL